MAALTRRRAHRKNQHVFLFRHCVRSTKDTVVNLYDGNGEQNVTDFVAGSFEWNTPPMWCTEGGLNTMKTTGELVMALLLDKHTDAGGSSTATRRTIRVRFITDTAQRDVDTAFALAEGMSAAAEAPTVAAEVNVEGLHNLEYMPTLFSPLHENNTASVCKVQVSQDRLEQEVRKRLEMVPPPDPGLNETLSTLQELAGVSPAGPILADDHDGWKLARDEKNDTTLQGPINVVKLLAQMIFYSRAGGVDPPFLPHATMEQAYQLVAWLHWSRAILSVHNSIIASEGAVLARVVLELLAAAPNDDEETVTIIVGHDSNLDALRTALNVTWELQSPYYQGVPNYSPTPPGSALHFYSTTGQSVELEYLYPVFTESSSPFRLQSAPLLMDVVTTNGSTTTNATIHGSGTIVTIDELRSRVLETLSKYEGSLECYQKAAILVQTQDSSYKVTASGVVLAVLGCLCLLGLASILCMECQRRRKERQARRDSYDFVSRQIDLD